MNDVDYNGNTSLHYAAQNGHTEIIKLLLNVEGIDANCSDRKGNTPLHLAAQNGHKDAIIILLDFKGIKPTLMNGILNIFVFFYDVFYLFFYILIPLLTFWLIKDLHHCKIFSFK